MLEILLGFYHQNLPFFLYNFPLTFYNTRAKMPRQIWGLVPSESDPYVSSYQASFVYWDAQPARPVHEKYSLVPPYPIPFRKEHADILRTPSRDEHPKSYPRPAIITRRSGAGSTIFPGSSIPQATPVPARPNCVIHE